MAPPWVEECSIDVVKRAQINLDANNSNNFEGMDGPFTMSEFNRALRSCRDKSSPGLDGIDYKMIKMLTERFKWELLQRLNYAFTRGSPMDEWKEIQTIFIGKKESGKFRPISMSSCVGKVLKRMLNDRII